MTNTINTISYQAYKLGNILCVPEQLLSQLQPLLEDLADFLRDYPYIRIEIVVDGDGLDQMISCDLYLYTKPSKYNPVTLADVKRTYASSLRSVASTLKLADLLFNKLTADILLLLLSDFTNDEEVYVATTATTAATTVGLPSITAGGQVTMIDTRSAISLLNNKTTNDKGALLIEVVDGYLEGLSNLKLPDVTVNFEYSFGNLVSANEVGVRDGHNYTSAVQYDEVLHRPVEEVTVEYSDSGTALGQRVVTTKYDLRDNDKLVNTVITDFIHNTETVNYSVQKLLW